MNAVAQLVNDRGLPVNSGVLWEGPSELTGAPVAVILTGLVTGSRNPKIGPMAQAWIIPADVEPGEAIHTGADVAVCGDCDQRPILGGACYVQWTWGPRQVAYTYQVARTYTQLEADHLGGCYVRFGAWGDPAAAPLETWEPVLPVLGGRVGYTHQWRHLAAADWSWLMASCDSPEDRTRAKDEGWPTFRIRVPGSPLLAGEIDCPAITHGITCRRCLLCAGRRGRGRHTRDPSIPVHGLRWRRFVARARRAA